MTGRQNPTCPYERAGTAQRCSRLRVLEVWFDAANRILLKRVESDEVMLTRAERQTGCG